MITTEVLIVGGGCVGLTTALALAEVGYKVVVVDKGPAEQELNEPQARVSAISLASQQVLENLGAWSELETGRLQPYDSMSVWDKHSFAKIDFDANDINQTYLGHIIENQNISNALIKQARKQANIELRFESEITSLHNKPDQVLLTLSDGTPILAQLLVAADGANSWVKQQLKAKTTYSDYDHHAIVCNIKTELANGNCARQVFLPEGPLALLPMADPHTCSIVWSTSPDHANQLTDMSDEQFGKALSAAADSVLGVCEPVSKRIRFPLTMRFTQQWLQDRVVFLGDAAHTIHPLAGLGMNLGLMDAASLADCLADKPKLTDPSIYQQLRKFERWRKAEAQTYILAMSSLKNLFDGDNVLKKLIRGVGLSLTNSFAPIKAKITSQAVGLEGDLPSLAKKRH